MDLYKILGVDKESTKAQIKKAYREMSKIHHPDKGGNEEDFKNINTAYKVLIDEEKRNRYDRTGNYEDEKDFSSRYASFMNNCIESIVNGNGTGNLIKDIKTIIDNHISGAKSELRNVEIAKERLIKAKDQLEIEEGEDIIGKIITARIESLIEVEENCKVKQDFFNKCLEEISKYKSSKESEEQIFTFGNLSEFTQFFTE